MKSQLEVIAAFMVNAFLPVGLCSKEGKYYQNNSVPLILGRWEILISGLLLKKPTHRTDFGSIPAPPASPHPKSSVIRIAIRGNNGGTMLTPKGLFAAMLLVLFASYVANAQTALTPGTYSFLGPTGNAWDAGWALNPSWGHPYYIGLYSLNSSATATQQFNFTSSGLLQSTANAGQYLYDLNGFLALGATGDGFGITSSGSGYLVKDEKTGLEVLSSGNLGAGQQLRLTSSGTAWTALSIDVPTPPVPPTTGMEIDDSNSAIAYSVWDNAHSEWYFFHPSAADYGGTEHSALFSRTGGTHFTSASAAINFFGTAITLIGKQGPNYGTVAYSIDGGALRTVNNYHTTELAKYPIATISGLSNGSHVLWVEEADNKWLTIDGSIITGTPTSLSSGSVKGYNAVGYSGSWTSCACGSTDLSGGHSWSGVAGASISWTFNGSLIEVFGRPDYEDGYMNVYIDDREVGTVDLRWGGVDDDSMNSTLLYAYKTATGGNHSIRLVVAGYADSGGPAGSNTKLIQFDEFVAFP